jgi:hypothetical protein
VTESPLEPFSIRDALDIAQTVIDLGLAMSSNPGKDLQLSSVVTVVNTIGESPDVSHIFHEIHPSNVLGTSGFRTRC